MDAKEILSELGFLKARKIQNDDIVAFDCPAENLQTALKILRDNFQMQSLTDIASVDFGEGAEGGRFGAVYHLFSHTNKEYVRLVCHAENDENPSLPSATPIYKSADWLEREAFDMMGINFEGHPSLRRILMWRDYPYHPLRKDFPLAGKPTSLPETFEGNEDATEVVAAPEEGGPFHSPSDGEKFISRREPRSFDGRE